MASISSWSLCINSLAPGRPRCDFKTAIFNLILLIGIFASSKDNALRWMPRDLTDDKSTLHQVMVWCRQATSHYLSHCWPSSMSPYGVTRPQWVKCPLTLTYGNTYQNDGGNIYWWSIWIFWGGKLPYLLNALDNDHRRCHRHNDGQHKDRQRLHATFP